MQRSDVVRDRELGIPSHVLGLHPSLETPGGFREGREAMLAVLEGEKISLTSVFNLTTL